MSRLILVIVATGISFSVSGSAVAQDSAIRSVEPTIDQLFGASTPWIQPVRHEAAADRLCANGCLPCDQSGSCAPGSCCDDLWTRPSLTNGLCGLQPSLAEHGIVYEAIATQFYQGVTSGGREQTFEYGGKIDQFMIFQGEKLGLWKGLEVILHGETRFGEDVIGDAAGLAPVNINMLYPSLDNTTALTGLQIMQALNEDWAITIGRINTLDLFQALYPQTGRGIDGFMNTSIFLPLTVGRTLPLVFNGAGILKMHGRQIQGGIIVLDPQNIPTTSGLNDMFANGATVAGFWRFFTDLGGRPGSHMFLGTWASGTFTSLDRFDWSIIPGTGIVAGQQTGSWSLLYILEQQLWADSGNGHRNVGLLSQWGLGDPETNPYAWVGSVSLQANGLIRGRESDSLGVGWFYNGLSSDFKNLLSPPLDLRDLTGVEVYYNAAITPWFHLTADIQAVEPADRGDSTAVLFGLRAKMEL